MTTKQGAERNLSEKRVRLKTAISLYTVLPNQTNRQALVELMDHYEEAYWFLDRETNLASNRKRHAHTH